MEEQATAFDPATFVDQQHAARSLTLLVRGLRAGERVVLPNGTIVKSIAIRHGANLRRRFAVVPGNGAAGQRHKALVLGKDSFPSATQAAYNALGLQEESS